MRYLTLDFDGVIHSYSSGWKGATSITDPPVPGAIEFIVRAQQHFTVAIHSARSHQGWFLLGGRIAMHAWLRHHLHVWMLPYLEKGHWPDFVHHDFGVDGVDEEADYWAKTIISKIKWPLFKPASFISIDDRCLTFNGKWPELETLDKFVPWNK